MTLPQPPHHPYSLHDLFILLKKARYRLLAAAGVVGGAFALYAFGQPIKYTVEASFREKNSSLPSLSLGSSALSAMLFNGGQGGGDSGTISTLKSRMLMEQLITAEGLQASITLKQASSSYWQRFKDNLRVEYARWMRLRHPQVPDATPLISCSEVAYAGEVPVELTLAFNDDSHYAVIGSDDQPIGFGEVDKLFATGSYSFMVRRSSSEGLTAKSFHLALQPLAFMAEDFSKLVAVTPHQEDKSLLLIKFRYPDRHKGASCLNTLMLLYQEQLHSEHRRFMAEQLRYLESRQDEVNSHLESMMHTYANNLSNEFSHLGFIDTQRAMEFLCNHQRRIKDKQLALNLEIKRLQQARLDGKICFENHHDSEQASSFLDKIVWQIQDLRQQRDSLQVSLTAAPAGPFSETHELFDKQLDELNALEETERDVTQLIAALEDDVVPATLPATLTSNDNMVSSWHAKLQEVAHQAMNDKDSGAYYKVDDVRERYLSYLNNFLRYLQVHAAAMEESLSHQQKIEDELPGADLTICKELFLNYSKEAHTLESQILQYSFVIEQLQLPQFEISSLCSILDDPVSNEVALAAKELSITIKDHSNQTQKELSRIEEELHTQRDFLVMHLKQAQELMKLRYDLLKGKLHSVQLATLALVQQQLSVAQSQLDQYLQLRVDNLNQELELLAVQQDELQQQMSLLPEKWVEEQLIYQQMELNRQMGKEITGLVESKNISSNLEIVQSAPLDAAIAPLHPDSPRLLFFAMLGAALGFLGMFAWTLLSAAQKVDRDNHD